MTGFVVHGFAKTIANQFHNIGKLANFLNLEMIDISIKARDGNNYAHVQR